MSEYLSKKLKFMSLISMLCVVIAHSYNFTDSFLRQATCLAEGFNPGAMIEFSICNGFVRFCIPLYFMISGYLFFLKYDGSWASYKKEVGKRCKTILLPFLIWVVFWTIILFLMHFFGNVDYVNAYYDYAMGHPSILLTSPFGFQLWFLFDLMKMVVLCPVVYFITKKCKGWPLLILAVFWVMDIGTPINSDAYMFFSLGALFAVSDKGRNIVMSKEKAGLLSAIFGSLTLIFVITNTCLSAAGISGNIRIALFRAAEITGIIAVWKLYDIKGNVKEGRLMSLISSASFMIYVLHQPTLGILNPLLCTQESSTIMHLIVFVLVPVVFSIFMAYFTQLLLKICPKAISVATGGRAKIVEK